MESHENFVGLILRIGILGEAEEVLRPEPTYGAQLQQHGVLGLDGEGTPRMTLEAVRGQYVDGEPFTLLLPRYHVQGLTHGRLASSARLSPRVAPAMIGLGLLEAIPPERVEALSDPFDADGDGTSGRVRRVWSAEVAGVALGRFGWKAEQPTVRQQTAAALRHDIGITSRFFHDEDCAEPQSACKRAASGGEPEISDIALDRLSLYAALLAVPARTDWRSAVVQRGKKLFEKAGCDGCHVPEHRTSSTTALPELAAQTIFPYTDLLLHDMGENLADGEPPFAAHDREWRTPPLWGVGLVRVVNGHDRLLHDGRARGVAEAILWHGGEAEAARETFRAMRRDERAALVRFVESL